jgi:hypothetical protein
MDSDPSTAWTIVACTRISSVGLTQLGPSRRSGSFAAFARLRIGSLDPISRGYDSFISRSIAS